MAFYARTLGLTAADAGCGKAVIACLSVNERQRIELRAMNETPSTLPGAKPSPTATAAASKDSRVAGIAFATTNVAQMRRYLTAKGLKADDVAADANHIKSFSVVDPEGHLITFIEQTPSPAATGPSPPATPGAAPTVSTARAVPTPGAVTAAAIPAAPTSVGATAAASSAPATPAPGADTSKQTAKNSAQVGTKLLHAGLIVRDRAAEDRFYKDILGFHLYWQGGMKDDEVSWVSMQVPDGSDWLEYMLNVAPNADAHTEGVMNHIALGVPSVAAAKDKLVANGWQPGEAPKVGRDGKWQLNVYDPDGTRVEFMEFTPVEKPCCASFTGTHPKP
jgi:catechol 2,3-dioxygenase-like lactoylglutathione lyase family enzyme